MAGLSKKNHLLDENVNETVLKWFQELDSDASDVGSASENENI